MREFNHEARKDAKFFFVSFGPSWFILHRMELKGKRALVTGGAVRIGAAIVKALQRAGAEVVVHYLASEEEAKALSPFTVRADLSNPDALAAMVADAGPLDILVNNAALFTKDDLATAAPERVRHEFEINLFAPLELTRRFAAQCASGAVINLLDRRVRANDPSCLPYSMTKKGLEELTKLTALELAPGIRVNAVAPGPILPPPGDDGSRFAERAGRVPLENYPSPEDIAEAALFLLRADYCTGQVVFVDGGQHLLGNAVHDQGV